MTKNKILDTIKEHIIEISPVGIIYAFSIATAAADISPDIKKIIVAFCITAFSFVLMRYRSQLIKKVER